MDSQELTEEYKRHIVEALIIANDVPISEAKIASLIEDMTPAQAKKAVDELNAEYSDSQRAFFIARVAGGFQINTRRDMAPWVKKMFKGRMRGRLSQAGLESLAIITFQQPISRVEVDAIRGVNSGGVVKTLLERNLITIAGRSSGPGKPLLYGTTKEFLRYLGVDDIKSLPKPKEIEEIMGKLTTGDGVGENIIEALAGLEDDGVDNSSEATAAVDGVAAPEEKAQAQTHPESDNGQTE